MRGYYLNSTFERSSGCRGGVGSKHGDGDYELEIGCDCNASLEMVALCVLYDEVIEFLKSSNSALGQMILRQHTQIQKEIADKDHSSKK